MKLPRLLTTEIPNISERWRKLVLPLLMLFAASYALTVTVDAMFHHSIMIGPGFVDEGISGYELAMQTFANIEQRYPQQGRLFIWVFLPLLALAMIQNAIVIVRGYTRFEKTIGKPYSLRELVLMFAMNGFQVLTLLLMLAAVGWFYWLAGGDFADGWTLVHRITVWCESLLNQVPTLIELPRPLPLIAALASVDLAYYALHRMSHSYRLPWLLLHRPHHMTENMMIPTVQPVFVAAPLFIVFAIPLQLLVGISTKLFNPDPMIVEALVLRLFTHTLGIYSHCAAYYEQMQHNPLLRRMSAFFGVGNYHYVHHSSHKEHSLINLGNNFWMLWDRVFGTYVEPPDTRPPTGLTNNPPLYMNPLRLALAGMLQIAYELKCNSLRLWPKILLGNSYYEPPVSHDFAINWFAINHLNQQTTSNNLKE